VEASCSGEKVTCFFFNSIPPYTDYYITYRMYWTGKKENKGQYLNLFYPFVLHTLTTKGLGVETPVLLVVTESILIMFASDTLTCSFLSSFNLCPIVSFTLFSFGMYYCAMANTHHLSATFSVSILSFIVTPIIRYGELKVGQTERLQRLKNNKLTLSSSL